MKKVLLISLIGYFIGIFINSQNSTITEDKTICDVAAYDQACHANNKNCAFFESRKEKNIYFACLAVQPKDCNFFCNYINELNTEGGIKTVNCICNGINYPTNSQ